MKKEFVAAALNLEYKTFIVYIAVFNIDLDDEIHPLKRALIAHLKANKAFIKILSKYADFADVFLPKLATKLLKHTEINNYAIKLVNN